MNNKDSSKKVWGANPAGSSFSNFDPGSKEFFEEVIEKRASYELPWLQEIVPFNSFKSKKVLEIGCGAGYDAFQFCQVKAEYYGIDITPENIERTRKHLAFYGISPVVEEGDAEALSFDDSYFDIVFSNGVLHHTPDISKSFREANRVLKSGGIFWVIIYNKRSVFYWINLYLYDHLVRGGFRKRTFEERLSMIEYTTSDARPIVNVFTRRELKKILHASGFDVEWIKVRKLVKEDLPSVPLVSKIWPLIPQRWLDFIGKRFGWYLIAKAKKP